jgi:hypothetical protein
MSGTLTLKGAVVQNTVPGTVPLSIFFWDHNNKMVLEVKPGEVTPFESIVAQYITVFLSQSAKKYFFPKSITLKPGNVIVFNPTMGRVKTATIFAEGKQVAQFDMVSSSALTDTPDDTAMRRIQTCIWIKSWHLHICMSCWVVPRRHSTQI